MNLKRLVSAATVAALVILGTAGCMKFDTALTVNNKDEVKGSVTIAVAKSLIELGKQYGSGSTSKSLDTSSPLKKLKGVKTKTFDDGTFKGATYTFPFVPLKKFNASGFGASQSKQNSLKITRNGDKLVVTGTLDYTGGDKKSAEDMKSNPFTKAIATTFSLKTSIRLPGKILKSNGIVRGHTVTWNATLGETQKISAVTLSPLPSKGLPIWIWIAAGTAVIALIAAAAIWKIRSNKKSDEEFAEDFSYEGTNS
jgi:hypothetical protein